LRLRSRTHDDRTRATSILQLKIEKNKITKNDKRDKYEKIAKYKQERYRCAAYNFSYQTIESILDHDIIRAREERERRQKREPIELSNEGFS